MFYFMIGSTRFAWNGAHTVNVRGEGGSRDVFSLDYGRDDYSRDEVRLAAREWISYTLEADPTLSV